jgi:hypothetical protein
MDVVLSSLKVHIKNVNVQSNYKYNDKLNITLPLPIRLLFIIDIGSANM